MTSYGFQDPSSIANGGQGIAAGLDDTETARRTNVLVQQFPELAGDPATLMSLTAGGTDQQMFMQASQAISLADLHQTADQLSSADPFYQRAKWAAMSPERQSALSRTGYQPPPIHPDDHGGWGIGLFGHDIATIGGKGSSGPLGMLGAGISDVLDVGAWNLSHAGEAISDVSAVPGHMVRTSQDLGPGGQNLGLLDKLNPAEWANSWNRTSNGMKYFRREDADKAQVILAETPWDQRLGPSFDNTQRLEIAKSIAAGEQAHDYARSLGLDEDQNPKDWHDAILKWNLIAGDGAVAKAADQLANGHITLGRQILHGSGIHDMQSPEGRVLSGAVDTWFAWKMDPIVLTSGALHAEQALRFGIRGTSHLGDLGETLDHSVELGRAMKDGGQEAALKLAEQEAGRPLGAVERMRINARANGVYRFADRMHPLAVPESPEATRLLATSPQATLIQDPYLEYLASENIKPADATIDNFFDYMSSTLGKQSTIEQAGLVGGRKALMVPHVTAMQQKAWEAKGLLKNAIDFTADVGANIGENAAIDPTTGKFDPTKVTDLSQLFGDKLIAPLAKTLRALSVHFPHGGSVALTGPNAVADLQRMAQVGEMAGMTAAETEAWTGKLVGSIDPVTGLINQNSSVRRGVAANFWEEFFRRLGLEDSDLAKKYVTKNAQHFGMDIDQEVRDGDVGVRAGVFDNDISNHIAIPDPREVIQAVRNQSVTKMALAGYQATPIEQGLYKIWKPLAIMHAGFVPRIVGEELLGHLVRSSPLGAARDVATKWAMQSEPLLDEEGHLERDALGRLRWGERNQPGSIVGEAARWFTSHLSNWTDLTAEEIAAGQERGRLDKLTGALDGYIGQASAWWSGQFNKVEGALGIPDRRMILANFVGPDKLDAWREAANSRVFSRALVGHTSGILHGEEETNAALTDPYQMNMGTANTPNLIDMDLTPIRGVYEPRDIKDHDGAVALTRQLNHMANSDVALPALDALNYASEEQAAKVHRMMGSSAVRGENPVETVRNLQYRFQDELGHSGKTIAQQIMDGDIKPEDRLAAIDEAMAKAPDAEREALGTLRLLVANKEMRNDDLGLLINQNLDPAKFHTNAVQAEQDLAARFMEMNTRPENFAKVREMDRANRVDGRQVAVPMSKGQQPLFTPMIGRQDLQALQTVAVQPESRQRLVDAFTEALHHRNVDMTPEEIVHAIDRMLPTDELHRAYRGTLWQAQELKRSAYVPAGLWGTGDPRVGDAMADALQQTLGARPTLGYRALPDRYWEGAGGATHDQFGLHAAGEAGTSRSFGVDGSLLTSVEPMHDRVTLHEVNTTDGRTRWVDPAELGTFEGAHQRRIDDAEQTLARLNGRLEVASTDESINDLKHEIHYQELEVQRLKGETAVATGNTTEANGITWTQALEQLSRDQAHTAMGFLSPSEHGPAHTLLEPMTRGAQMGKWPSGQRVVGSALTPDHVAAADNVRLPPRVWGPQLATTPDTKWSKVTKWWFDGVVGPALSTLSRNPMFVEAYARSAHDYRVLLEDKLMPIDVRDRMQAVVDKLGINTLDNNTLRRFANRLPDTIVEPGQSTRHVNAVLGNLFGMNLANPEDLDQLNQLRTETNSLRQFLAGAERDPTFDDARRLLGAKEDEISKLEGRVGAADPQVAADLERMGAQIPEGMTRDQFIAHFEAQQAEVLGAEKKSRWANWTPEMRDALARGDSKAFSKLRGYTPEEYATFEAHHDLMPPAVREHPNVGHLQIPYPEGSANAGDMAHAVDPGDLYDTYHQLGRYTMGVNSDEAAGLRRWLKFQEGMSTHIDEVASQAALQHVVPYIHDPAQRSQFQGYVSTLMPFQFAQEQFLKRWAKTFANNPEAAKRLMLIHDGLRNTGMVQQDPNTGEETFIWPGSDQINNLMAHVNPLWPGAGTFRGLAYSPLSGSTQMIIPGFGDPIAPNLGPAAGLALHSVAHMYPEFAPLEQALASDKADPNRSALEWVMPAHLNRIYEAVAGDTDKGVLAGMNKQAVMYLVAHGQGPPTTGTDHDKQKWLDSVRDLTRTSLLYRGLFGLFGPSGGTQMNYHDALADDIRAMLADGLSPQEAYDTFVAKHQGKVDPSTVFPAYTVFATKSTGGAPLPQGQKALDFMQDNSELIKEFPAGAAWLLPQNASTDPRARMAYQEQMRTGLRTTRTPDEFLDQLIFAEAADTYFHESDHHNALVGSLPVNSAAADDENAKWKLWSDSYKDQHPVFKNMLEEPTAKQRRDLVRTQLGDLLSSPDTPATPQAPGLRDMLQSWNSLQQNLNALKWGPRTVAATRKEKELPQQFAAWAETFLTTHPELRSFYSSVLVPDLPNAIGQNLRTA